MAQIYKSEAVIFDLDDLLFKEFDCVRSGYWKIAQLVDKGQPKKIFNLMMAQYFLGNPVIDWLINDHLRNGLEYTKDELLAVYRNHLPDISINAEVADVLNQLSSNNNKMGLITDGRSITQRNKINALGLSTWIDEFVISEETGFQKPSPQPFLYFMEKFDVSNFVYVADNYNKDFIAPNQLGWRTIALTDNGLNVHTCKENLEAINRPSEVIKNLRELRISTDYI
jgi:putative hydrolase of the HAD superfamily